MAADCQWFYLNNKARAVPERPEIEIPPNPNDDFFREKIKNKYLIQKLQNDWIAKDHIK